MPRPQPQPPRRVPVLRITDGERKLAVLRKLAEAMGLPTKNKHK